MLDIKNLQLQQDFFFVWQRLWNFEIFIKQTVNLYVLSQICCLKNYLFHVEKMSRDSLTQFAYKNNSK